MRNTGNTAKRRIAFLKQMLPFSEVNENVLQAMLEDIHVKRWKNGEMIFHQGASSTELYIVHKGKVRVYKSSSSGKETSIVVFSTKSVIGEFALIDGQNRSASAKAVGNCELLIISRDKLMEWMKKSFPLALGMMRLLTSKARWTANYAEIMAQYDVPGRFFSLMLLYNEQLGREIEPGKVYELDMGLTQEDLATLIGVRREWLNRRLTEWRKLGLLEYKQRKIIILNLEALQREQQLLNAPNDETSW